MGRTIQAINRWRIALSSTPPPRRRLALPECQAIRGHSPTAQRRGANDTCPIRSSSDASGRPFASRSGELRGAQIMGVGGSTPFRAGEKS
ncbi:unnamed protein product, partial [Iphiclides podalirius]